MGHEVVHFSEKTALARYEQRLLLRAARRLLHGPLEPHRRRHAAEFRSAVRNSRPDIVIVLKGLHLSAADISSARATGAWVVNINHDDFFSANPNNWSKRQREAIPAYDYIFQDSRSERRGGSPPEQEGCVPSVRLLSAFHRPIPLASSDVSRFLCDVVFVGTWEEHRARLLQQLAERVPARYRIWGSQWDRIGRGSPLRPSSLAKKRPWMIFQEPSGVQKIALGFLRKENRDEYTQRSLEISAESSGAGSGAAGGATPLPARSAAWRSNDIHAAGVGGSCHARYAGLDFDQLAVRSEHDAALAGELRDAAAVETEAASECGAGFGGHLTADSAFFSAAENRASNSLPATVSPRRWKSKRGL